MSGLMAKMRQIREQHEQFRISGISGIELQDAQKAGMRKINRFGVSYFLTFDTTALLVATFITIPELHKNNTDEIPVRMFLSIFLYLQIMINFYMIAVKSKLDRYPGSGKNGFIPMQTPQNEWKQCKHCLIKTPPRAHHCPICNTCILKRDHHCFFVYSCVGFHNQRYFTVMLFYATLAGWYSLYLLRNYLETYYIDPFSGNFYRIVVPVAVYDWWVGRISFGVFLLAMFLYCVIFSALAATFFLSQQVIFTVSGRTSYEFQNNITKYSLGPFDNLRTVFGSFGILNFLMPCPWLKSDGDGMTWKSKGI
ncbi:palmitoyltransferase ZDHHC22-like [Lineus longissimus]|uniref:palmitoyltransferase ZDHHC22-like n=1 Tax=Lineus longissimus TaxID=88925 RepID=UPI002B4C83C1